MSTGGLILAGDVRLGFYDNSGAFLGYMQDPINVTELTPVPGEGEEIVRESRMRDTYGQALDALTAPAPYTVTFTTDTISREILRALFLGLDTDITVASGSITEEPIIARVGKWVPTSQVMLAESGLTVTTNGGSPTTLTKDTDYLVDLRNGAILALPGGAISEGDTILVSASYGGREGFKISAGRREAITAAFLLDGRSLRPEDSGKVIRWKADRINFRPAGGNDLMSQEWLSAQFSGTILIPQGASEPFTYEEYSAVE